MRIGWPGGSNPQPFILEPVQRVSEVHSDSASITRDNEENPTNSRRSPDPRSALGLNAAWDLTRRRAEDVFAGGRADPAP